MVDFAWDIWCAASIVGIWPRFIEPRLLETTHLNHPIKNLDPALEKLKILHFSDLHINPKTSDTFLKKMTRRIQRLAPDIIVFTGDFICYSELNDQKRLETFLNSLSARYGCYCVLGNHDYETYVTFHNKAKKYEIGLPATRPLVVKGLRKLLIEFNLMKEPRLTQNMLATVKTIPMHEELVALIKRTPFELLENKTKVISINGSDLNIVGLGDYWLQRSLPQIAFEGYNSLAPGLILAHNPDAASHLEHHPGELILCGHTHGGQVNLLGIWKLFTPMESPHLRRGLVKLSSKKTVYVSRGVGSPDKFRWFSSPEITLFTLSKQSKLGNTFNAKKYKREKTG